jgi:glycosyltransferase involved in cell wall biosynthesis
MTDTLMGARSSPLVSVIIPAYNTAPFIGEALNSLLGQTYTNWEAIVINDGSPDTPELEQALVAYRDRIIYLEQPNGGSSAARNAGIRHARGQYIALLDSDDLWEPAYLATHVSMLEADPAVDVVFPNALLFGETEHCGRAYMDVFPLHGPITYERLLVSDCYVWGGVTARREAVVSAGAFDEELGSAEDLDLWLRILYNGGKVIYHREVLARYRKRAGSHTSDAVWLHQNYLKLLRKISSTVALPAELAARVERRYTATMGEMHRAVGKQAFQGGHTQDAIAELTEANRHLRSRKLTTIILLLRLVPQPLRWLYEARERLEMRSMRAS